MNHASRRTPFASSRALVAVMGLAVAGLGMFVLSSCGPRGDRSVALIDTGTPALHAVSNAQLSKAMAELDNQAGENLRMELYTGTSDVDMTQVAKAAASMAATAENIPAAVPALNLDQSEKQVFLKLAAKLRDEARTLSDQAGRNQRTAALATMNRITATCNACHASFRLGR